MTILRAFRILFLCGLFLLHIVLLTLNGLVLGSGNASPFEVFHCGTDLVVIFIITIAAVYKLTHRNAEPVNTPNIIAFGSIWLTTLSGSIALTIRLNSVSPGLCQDFLQFDSECKFGSATVALSWMTTIIALVGVMIAIYDKHPGAIELVPHYTGGALPPRVPSKSARDMRRLAASTDASSSYTRPEIKKPAKAKSALKERDLEMFEYWGSGWFGEENTQTLNFPSRVKNVALGKAKRQHDKNKGKAPSGQNKSGMQGRGTDEPYRQYQSEWY